MSNPSERKKEIIRLQEEYLKGWRIKRPERLNALENHLKNSQNYQLRKVLKNLRHIEMKLICFMMLFQVQRVI